MTDLDLEAIKAECDKSLGTAVEFYRVRELVAEVERLRGLANVFEINVLQPWRHGQHPNPDQVTGTMQTWAALHPQEQSDE